MRNTMAPVICVSTAAPEVSMIANSTGLALVFGLCCRAAGAPGRGLRFISQNMQPVVKGRDPQ